MRKKLLTGLLVLVFVFPVFADKYENAGIDYTKCVYETKTPEARVKCFQGYIQTYPDTGKRFTRLAYCMLALNHFDTKNYAKTVEIGEKSLKIGVPDDGLRAKLFLAMGNAYGIGSSAVFDKSKAIKYTDQAIEQADKAGLTELAQNARGLKKRLMASFIPRTNRDPKLPVRVETPFDVIARYEKLPDLNEKIKIYNQKPKPKPLSEEEIKKRVRRIEYMIRKEERRLEEKYPDTDPPDFELKTLNKLKKDLARVKSGPGPVEDKEGAELLAQKEKVDKEFAALVVQVKSRN